LLLQERELFQGLIKAGGIILLVKGIYLHSLWGIDTLVYQAYRSPDVLIPSAFIIMGILLLVGSTAIMRFAYIDNYGIFSWSSIVQMGVKLLGVWLIYRQLIVLVSIVDYWKMNWLVPEMTRSIGGGYWVIQLVIAMVALVLGLVFIRYRPDLKSNREGVQ
jgi:hypothetical protein